jgi:hypothetical protein
MNWNRRPAALMMDTISAAAGCERSTIARPMLALAVV